jgi:hypothetical protein
MQFAAARTDDLRERRRSPPTEDELALERPAEVRRSKRGAVRIADAGTQMERVTLPAVYRSRQIGGEVGNDRGSRAAANRTGVRQPVLHRSQERVRSRQVRDRGVDRVQP